MASKPDLAQLFVHVDAALPLLANASGELGSAGTAAFADTSQVNPFVFISWFKKFFGQRRAKRDLKAAAPHLQAIQTMHAEAKTWLASAPESDPAALVLIDLWAEGGGAMDAVVDGIIHDRIETKLLELNALLDEIGRLHARLRASGAPKIEAP